MAQLIVERQLKMGVWGVDRSSSVTGGMEAPPVIIESYGDDSTRAQSCEAGEVPVTPTDKAVASAVNSATASTTEGAAGDATMP